MRNLNITAVVLMALVSLWSGAGAVVQAAPYSVETGQPICVPRLPAGTSIDIDGNKTGPDDWENIAFVEIGYADDPSGNLSTLLAADDTYLYFFTEVVTPLDARQGQVFLVGVDAPGGARKLEIHPFQASDDPNGGVGGTDLSDNNIYSILVAGGTWTSYTPPPNTDFWRTMTDDAGERWMLEGRLNQASIGITDIDNFDIFFYVNAPTSSSPNVERYWPDQGGGFVDIDTPASLIFGQNRCPNLAFSEPYLNFGKKQLDPYDPYSSSVTISNDGTADSVLQVENITLNPPGSPFTLESVSKGGTSILPPYAFTLSTSETAEVVIGYNPTHGSTIGDPHHTDLRIESNDPDEGRASLSVEGYAREPIDTIFILDQSGSMLNRDKWVTTEWATDSAFEVLRLFSIGNDQVGAVGFGGSSSNPQSFVLAAKDFFPNDPTYFTSSFADANNAYYTPIGLGIEEPHGQFDIDERTHIGILMSDGKHNRPAETKDATTVAGLNLPLAVERNSKNMHIHTIALGRDGGVSTGLLEDIRGNYNGDFTTYNITDDPTRLAELFIEPLVEPFMVNRVAETADGYPIPQRTHKALAMVIWERTVTPQPIKVHSEWEDGTIRDYDSGSSGYTGDSDHPYSYILLEEEDKHDLAQNQTWQVLMDDGSSIDPDDGYIVVLEDLNITGLFSVDQSAAGTGNDLILKAKLTEVGRPITNRPEHPVRVTALIAKPDEGFGTYVATHSLENCQASAPTLPALDLAATDAVTMSGPDVNLLSLRIPPDTAIQGPFDVPAPRFQKIDALFELCKKEGLLRSELPGLELYDDGTNGDEVADDGIYTRRFTNTKYEGSYVIRFTVQGTSPTDAIFSRLRTLSRHLTVNVDPTTTLFDSRIIERFGTQVIREYYVIPLDRFGNYLGPGYLDQVKFNSTGGDWLDKYINHNIDRYNNGIYSRILQYDITQGEPNVTVAVQGKAIPGGARPESTDKLCVAGQVINHQEQPLAGWVIRAESVDPPGAARMTSSDDEGNFRFDDLSVGQWNFAIGVQTGWEPVTDDNFEVKLTYGLTECRTIRFKMRRVVTVSVLKIDEQHVPQAGWTIRAEPGLGNEFAIPQELTTDTTGVATFTLSLGHWIFSEIAPDDIDYTPISPPTGVQELIVTAPGPHTIRFKNFINLNPLGCITVTKREVVDDLNQTPFGLPGWEITVRRADGSVADQGETDALGQITFSELPFGTYTVSEKLLPGLWEPTTPTSFAVTLDNEEQCVEIEFYNKQVAPGYCIVGRKVDTNGLVGLPDWRISAKPIEAGGYVPGPEFTDGKGYFRIDFPNGDNPDYRIPSAKYEVCEEVRPGWLPHTATCQTVQLPSRPGVCTQLKFDFENQQVGHVETEPTEPSDPTPGCWGIHTVRRGEGLYQIGADYGVSRADILAANPWVKRQYRMYLYRGQKVCIPYDP
ncbi:LysM peptidoglycan-binding domain-containing protein [Chloroflexi bacterium TSY]|nr:LysM peptidoglycan-binding domain-containing protein [Chloroflexi bacterium TSY]